MVAPTANSTPFVVLPQGAIIQYLCVGDHNVVLSLPTPELYSTHNTPFFGETIGRVANRISGARIKNLNGRSYDLFPSDGNGLNCLHGGRSGWGKKLWIEGPQGVTAAADNKTTAITTVYTYHSEDGEEGFPGTVDCHVYYTFEAGKNNDGEETSVLDIEYEARMVGAKEEEADIDETAVALTNHSYFNTGADPNSIAKTTVNIATNLHLPVDALGIPTGKVEPFPGIDRPDTTFELGATQPSFDHCFIMNSDVASIPLDTRPLPLRRLITMSHRETGIELTIESTEPAFQLYTGEGIDVPALDGMATRGARSGVAVEPGRYVNAVNDKRWKGMVVLKRGAVWGSRSRYTLRKAGQSSC